MFPKYFDFNVHLIYQALAVKQNKFKYFLEYDKLLGYS